MMNDDERRESTGFPAVTSPAIPGNTPSAVNGRGRKEGCSSDDSPLLRSGPPVQSGIDEIADEEGKKRGGGGIGSCRRRSPAARHRGNARRGRIQRDCGRTDPDVASPMPSDLQMERRGGPRSAPPPARSLTGSPRLRAVPAEGLSATSAGAPPRGKRSLSAGVHDGRWATLVEKFWPSHTISPRADH